MKITGMTLAETRTHEWSGDQPFVAAVEFGGNVAFDGGQLTLRLHGSLARIVADAHCNAIRVALGEGRHTLGKTELRAIFDAILGTDG